MKRSLALPVSVFALFAAYSLLVRATIAVVPSGTWAATSDMMQARAGASATLLQGGAMLITGGVDQNGVVLATAERYSPIGGDFLATPPMQAPRANHTTTLLTDGRVLVAGGAGPDGHAIAAAEVYDPAANAWTPAASLYVARRGHTATLLPDGTVLIAGGDDSGLSTGTLEIFDPVSSTFALLDATLGDARTLHAAAALADGRVLIAGGFDGTQPLASTTLYDPKAGTIAAGPALSTARSGLTATALLDGKVLIAGGTSTTGELASAELFDPSTNTFTALATSLGAARQNHLAFLLPHNNSVLIVGGTAGGSAVATAEVYVPWEGTTGAFCSAAVCASGYAGPAAPNVARQWAAGGALSRAASATNRSGPSDGLLLLTGGTGLKSAELFGFATVKTDKDDYAPGTTVRITGSGWRPGETVALLLKESPTLDEHPLLDVTADANGNIVSTEFAPDEHDLNIRFYLTAFGLSSQAQTTFTDAADVTLTPATGGGAISSATVGGAYTALSGPVLTENGSGAIGTGTIALNVPSGFIFDTGGVAPSVRVAGDATSGHNINNAANGSLIALSVTSTSLTLTITAKSNSGAANTLTWQNVRVRPTSATPLATGNITKAGTSSYTVVGSSTNYGTLTEIAGTVATTLSVSAASGAYGGTTTLSATLTRTSDSSAVSGKTITFTLNGTGVGSGVTNASGVATLAGASLTGNNVGSYPAGPSSGVGASFAGDSGFSASTGSNGLVVNAAAVTVSFVASDKTYDGTTAATVSTCVITSGKIGGDDVTCTVANGNFASASASPSAQTVSATATLAGAKASNYSVTNPVTTTAKITPKLVTVTYTAADKTYDGTTAAVVSSCAIATGKVGADDLTCSIAGGTFASASASASAQTVSATATLTGAAAANYTVTNPVTASAKINPKPVTATIAASDKIYDRNTDATITSRTLTGVIGTDDVTLSGGTGSFADKNVGTAKTVTVTGLTLSGTKAANYQLTSTTASTTANITPKTLVASFTAQSRPYDGTTTATILTQILAGVIAPDAVTLTGGTATFADRNAGIGKTVTATGFTLSGTDNANYKLGAVTSWTATADITPKTLVGSFTAQSRPYDATAGATILTQTLSGVIVPDAVTLTGGTATFDNKNVGTGKTVTATGFTSTGADNANYSLGGVTSWTTTADITPKTLIGTFTAQSRPYDGTASATILTQTLTGVIVPDVVTLIGGTATFDNKNVGTSKTVTATGFTLTGADSANYGLGSVTSWTATADITAKTLVGSFTAQSRSYDGTAGATILTQTLSGVINPDAVTLTGGTATFDSKNAGTGKTVTATGFTLTGADNANYSLGAATSWTTTADIAPKTLVGSFTAQNRPYDGTASATILTQTLSGVIVPDSVTLTGGTATFDNKNAGLGKTVTATGFTLTGADNANYSLGGVTSWTTTANITPKTLVGSFTAQSRSYDGTASATILTQTLSGVIVPDSVTLTGGTATFDNRNAGTGKTVTATGFTLTGADNANYSLGGVTSWTTTADITAKTLVGSFTAQSRSYDGTAGATILTHTLTGVIAPDVVTLIGGTATFDNKNVGTGKTVTASGFTLTGADNANYSLGLVTSWTTTADITAITLTASIVGDPTKPYDANTTATLGAANFSLTPVVAGESIVVHQTSGTYNSADVAAASSVTATLVAGDFTAGAGTDLGNYILPTGAAGAGHIVKAPTTTTLVGTGTFPYDGNAHGATATVTGAGGLSTTATVVYSGGCTAAPVHVAQTPCAVDASYPGDTNHLGSAATQGTITITPVGATISATGGVFTYDANPHAATATAKALDGTTDVTGTFAFVYTPPGTSSAPVNAAATPYTVSVTFTSGNTDYTNGSGSTTITINKAASATVVTAADATYDAAPHGGTAQVTGVGGLNAAVTPVSYVGRGATVYPESATAPTAAGDYTASASFAGDANHTASSDSKTFTIAKANASVVVAGYTGIYDAAAHGASLDHATGVAGADLSGGVNLGASFSNVPGGTAHWTFSYPNYNDQNGDVAIAIGKANAAISVTPYNVAYDGNSHTATDTAKGVLNVSLDGLVLSGTTHTNAANYSGDGWTFTDATGNYNNASGTVTDNINQAPSTVTVTCPSVSQVYTGSAQTPCTAQATGAGMTPVSVTPLTYANNINVGTATAAGTWPGDANHTTSTGSGTFAIGKAPSATAVTCPASKIYTGSAIMPCTAAVTGVGGLALTPTPTYTNNVNVGANTAVASYSFTGDANHSASSDSKSFSIVYAWDGYLQPINDTAHTGLTMSNFKLGQTIPAKFVIKNAAGVVVQQTGNPGFTWSYFGATCGTTTVTEAVEQLSPTDAPVYIWDGSQYHYNWSTKGLLGGLYQIFAHLANRNDQSVLICLSK